MINFGGGWFVNMRLLNLINGVEVFEGIVRGVIKMGNECRYGGYV